MIREYTNLLECEECGQLHLYGTRSEDAYGYSLCPICKHTEYKTTNSEAAHKFWTVAIYDIGEAYGGPEEGGWWYTEGVLTEYSKIKVFDNFKKATKYYNKLNKKEYYVVGYNDKFPDTYFPSVRPRYC